MCGKETEGREISRKKWVNKLKKRNNKIKRIEQKIEEKINVKVKGIK